MKKKQSSSRKKTQILLLSAIVLVVAALGLLFAFSQQPVVPTGGSSQSEPQSSDPVPPEPKTTTVSLVAVGDNLIHDNIYTQANNRTGGDGYDFRPAYENFAPYIAGHDIAFINQETLICNDEYAPSGYPSFNSPTDLGDQMIELGFNAFSQANNHMLDKGIAGMNACLDYWDTKTGDDLVHFGAYRDEADYENIRTMEINGIVFSFVSFTEHTNGIPLPSDADNVIVYTSDMERMQHQIEKAASISDFVIVSPHWGVEGSQIVTDNQRYLATCFADWGADLIIGTHPHVLQPIEFVESSDGSKKVLTAFSLGNFISSQAAAMNLVGGMMDLELEFDLETKEYTWVKTKFVPTVTWYGYDMTDVKVYAFKDYTEDLSAIHGCKAYDGRTSYDYMQSVYENIIDEKFLY